MIPFRTGKVNCEVIHAAWTAWILRTRNGTHPDGPVTARPENDVRKRYRLHTSGTDERPSGRSYSSQWQSPRCFTLKPFALYSS